MNSVKVLSTEQSWIQKTPDVCGGDACIRDTRIPVWTLVVARRNGVEDSELIDYFTTRLSPSDIEAAVAYFETHPQEIEQEIRLNEGA
jgi:uncharacterized protein (DUF433 family)